MTWKQLQTWRVFFELEPFGEEAAWMRHGIACSLTANINRDPKKGKPFEPIDFMPYASADKPEPDYKSGWESFKSSVKAALGKKKRKGE